MKKTALLVVGTWVLYAGVAQAADPTLYKDLCKVIDFGAQNGSTVSPADLSHCHVIVPQNAPDDMKVKEIDLYSRGLLCHAHGEDFKRVFHKDQDNVNIAYPKGGIPQFLRIPEVAYAAEVKDSGKFSDYGSFPKMNPNVFFFKQGTDACNSFREKSEFSCGTQKYCVGLDSDYDFIGKTAAMDGKPYIPGPKDSHGEDGIPAGVAN